MSFLKSYASNFFAYVDIILVTNEPLIRAWMNIPSVELGLNISSRELGLDKRFAGSKSACNNGVQAWKILSTTKDSQAQKYVKRKCQRQGTCLACK